MLSTDFQRLAALAGLNDFTTMYFNLKDKKNL